MCPALVSTAIPSGTRPPVAMTFLSVPSGFAESTRPLLASRKNRRANLVLFSGLVWPCPVGCVDVVAIVLVSWLRFGFCLVGRNCCGRCVRLRRFFGCLALDDEPGTALTGEESPEPLQEDADPQAIL